MGLVAGNKYRVKWTNLSEELERDYGSRHGIFKDPNAVRPQKQQKISNQPSIAPSADRSSVAVLNENDGLELYPSDPEVSESDAEDPQIPGDSPLLVGGNQWRHDPALDALDPRMGGPICERDARIRFPKYIRAGETPSEVDCVKLFMHHDLISHLVMHTNITISEDKLKVTEPEMNRWIGIMFAMTLSSVPNVEDFWQEEDEGLLTAQRFGSKLNMGKTRFKFIRKHFKTGEAVAGANTFDGFRPIQDFF